MRIAHETIVERGALGGEFRRAVGAHVARMVGYSLRAKGAAASALRSYFETLEEETVGMPDWTCGVELTSAASGSVLAVESIGMRDFRVNKVIVWESSLSWEVADLSAVADTQLTLTASLSSTWPRGTRVFPLRVGKLESWPEPEALTDRAFTATLDWEEISAESCDYTKQDPNLDLWEEFGGRPIWPYRPHWGRPQDGWQVNVEWNRLGFGVETPVKQEDHPRRKARFSAQESSNEAVWSLIRFFERCKGRRYSFWMPSYRADVLLASNAAAGATTLTVSDCGFTERFAARPECRFLYVYRGDGSYEIATINAVTDNGDGTETVTLATGLTEALEAARSTVSFLFAMRFVQDELDLTWHTDSALSCKVDAIELPQEYGVTDEGDEPVWLYEFTRGETVYRYTSFARAFVIGGNTWTPADIAHDDDEQALDLWDEGPKIELNAADDHWLRLLPAVDEIEFRLYQVDQADEEGSLPEALFAGELASRELGKGQSLILETSLYGGSGEVELASIFIQRKDNNPIFSGQSGLDPDDYELAATLSAVGQGWVESTDFETEATTRTFADWFSLGRLEFEGLQAGILRQDGIRLYLSEMPAGLEVGSVVSVWPGYDADWSTRQARFPDHRFIGDPFLPALSPFYESFKMGSQGGGGGK